MRSSLSNPVSPSTLNSRGVTVSLMLTERVPRPWRVSVPLLRRLGRTAESCGSGLECTPGSRFGRRRGTGLDVIRGARIKEAGHGGQVLLSKSTAALIEDALIGGLSLRNLGPHRL